MSTSEKFCLRWNDFQENISTAFKDLRKDSEFTDVTLVCEDGQQVEAHKVILSASSPFFQNLLKRNKHAHPLIYMRGMNSDDLLAIVDFFYYGEANIYQANLDNFLNIAEELKLKGLNSGGGEIENPKRQYNKPPAKSNATQQKHDTNETSIVSQNSTISSQYYSDDHIMLSTAVALPKQEFSGDMNDLDAKIETMIGRGENMIQMGKRTIKSYVCKVCGKEGQRTNIKDHIEANHLEGISIPCSLCDTTFRSRQSFNVHNSRFHKCKNQ